MEQRKHRVYFFCERKALDYHTKSQASAKNNDIYKLFCMISLEFKTFQLPLATVHYLVNVGEIMAKHCHRSFLFPWTLSHCVKISAHLSSPTVVLPPTYNHQNSTLI